MDQDAVTHLHQQQSPLLRLPSELRSTIFSLAIGGHAVDVGKGHAVTNDYRLPNDHRKPHALRLNILTNGSIRRLFPTSFNAVCRQIRHETAGMYWAANTFCGAPSDLIFFLRHIRAKAQLLRKLKIIPNGYVLFPDRYHPWVCTLNYKLVGTLQRLRGLRGLEKVVVRLELSDSREEASVRHVVTLSKHALEWVGGRQGLAVEVE